MEDTNGIDCDGLELSKEREKATNYFRLVQLIMVEGTNVVRKTILNRLRQRRTLHTILADRRSEFLQRGSGFNRQQLDVLYPVNGNADLAKFDMTLWFALARRLRVLPKNYLEDPHVRIDENDNTSTSTPLLGTQVDWCQDLAAIYAVRNNLFHLVKPEMDTEISEDLWTRLTEALYRLDPGLDPSVIERYRTAELNPKEITEIRAMIMDQCFQERCEDLADEVSKKNRIIQLILASIAMVLLVILVAILLFVLFLRQKRTYDENLIYLVFGNLAGLDYLPRSGWGALPPRGHMEPRNRSASYIVYTHTADISQCTVTEECCNQVKNIQYLHMYETRDRFSDIAFHYLIDNKGIVYEGRNISLVPSAVYKSVIFLPPMLDCIETRHWNRDIISIAFIGNFMYQHPTVEALTTFDLLIAYLRHSNYIIQNYTIYGMCECVNTLSPGPILYDEINRSILSHLSGHVRHRPDNFCLFNISLAADFW